MKGEIQRVTLENFVTYKRVEFHPKSNLNVIVGPNGTGKSSIVCGIILGLGGKPKTVARGANIGSYVREGCQDATIEIELLNPGGKNYVVKRCIDVQNKSYWALNGKAVSQKEIEKCTSDLNIQVDNLCQFLPQDRVQDFAKMDQKSLLDNTEKTVGSEEMYEQHMQLKQLRNEQLEIEKIVKDLNARIAVEQQLNDRNSVQVTNLNEKKILVDCITLLKQKRAWTLWMDMLDSLKQLKADKLLAVRESQKYQNLFGPMDALLKEIASRIQQVNLTRTKVEEEIRANGRTLKDRLNKSEAIEEKIDENAEKLKRDKEAERSRKEDMARLVTLINKTQNDAEAARPEPVIREEIRAVDPLIQQSNGRSLQLKGHIGDRKADIETIKHEIVALKAEKRRVENTLNQKLDMLRRNNGDVYRAVMWLRDNQHQFTGKVYEPMILEINVTEKKYARYVEKIIPHRDLFAFTCEDRKDMNSLCRILRDEKGLKVNVIHSSSVGPNFRPKDKIETLRTYGFETYARETFTAPDAIMNFLCANCNVHRIPIGNDVTFRENARVPMHINNFFSENHQFITSKSKYCGDISSLMEPVGQARFLVSSMDPLVLAGIEDQLQGLETRKNKLEHEVEQISARAREEEDEMAKCRLTKRKLQEEIDRRKLILAQLTSRKQQLQQMQGEQSDMRQLEERYARSCRADTLKLVELQRDVLKLMQESHRLHFECDILREQAVRLADFKLIKENESQELKAKKRQAEQMVQNLQNRIENSRDECNRLREAANELTHGLDPSSPDFVLHSDAGRKLPDDILELESMIEEKQAKVDCLGGGDDHLLAEFERRKKLISELTEQVANQEKALGNIQATMDAVRDQWLPPLQDLISRICQKFGQSFNHLGCAGEVTLTKGDNENDYHLYGLCIKVKYRDGESLQQLNQHLQSGGERAVATAIYMISLQELTCVPFRCVDEINQGMDPVNERLIFDLLVKTTSESESAQYFLLTPKLLPSLSYDEAVNVICVCNGPGVGMPVWNVRRLLAKKKSIDY